VFTGGLALLTALLFGLAPAVAATRTDLSDVLKEGTRGSSGGIGSARARSALLVAEVAVSLVLLAGAGVMLKSFARLQAVDAGFTTERLLTGRITLPPASYDTLRKVAFYEALLPRLRALPGVESAALTSAMPLGGQNAMWGYLVEGRALATQADMPVAVMRVVDGAYFRTLGIPLVRGRTVEARDRAGAPGAVVVSEALARQHFPGEDPIGKRVRPGGNPEAPAFEIVGVVGDSKHRTLDEEPVPQMYMPLAQAPDAFSAHDVVLRTTGDAAALIAALRREVRAIDPDVPVADVRTMDELLASGVARQRMSSGVLAGFAALALLLAALGIYGVIAYSTAQRSREFGVRIALGAQRGDVLRVVLGGATRLVVLGIALGLGASVALTRLLASQLYEVSATDPAVLATISALLGAVAVAASYLPARRATRVDPVVTLRSE
jgi:predicted permease